MHRYPPNIKAEYLLEQKTLEMGQFSLAWEANKIMVLQELGIPPNLKGIFIFDKYFLDIFGARLNFGGIPDS